MALSSNQLEAFYAVSQAGSFTKAAERLHVTQSALSQRILNLELELGTTLFIRDRAGLRLTEVAQNLMQLYKTTSGLEADFLSSLKSKDQMRGVIRIAGFSSVTRSVIIPALAPLLKRHPQIQFQCMSREFSELLPLLKSGEVDFIVTDRPYEREELESSVLGEERNVLVEVKNYDGPDIYLDNDENDKTTLDYLRLIKRRIEPLPRLYLDDVYGLIDGVLLGLGRAVLPRHLIAKESRLTILNPVKSLNVKIYLHHFRQPFYSRLHQLVVSELKERAPALLKI